MGADHCGWCGFHFGVLRLQKLQGGSPNFAITCRWRFRSSPRFSPMNQTGPIIELVDELASEEDGLNSLEYDTDLSVRAAFALSYRRLPDDLKRLFRLMSVVPGGDVGLEAAGWLVALSHTAVRPQLMALVRSHLIQQNVRNRWSMHDFDPSVLGRAVGTRARGCCACSQIHPPAISHSSRWRGRVADGRDLRNSRETIRVTATCCRVVRS